MHGIGAPRAKSSGVAAQLLRLTCAQLRLIASFKMKRAFPRSQSLQLVLSLFLTDAPPMPDKLYLTTPIYYVNARAPHRPRLHDHCCRRHRAPQARRWASTACPHRHRRARPEDRALRRKGCQLHAPRIRRPHLRRVPRPLGQLGLTYDDLSAPPIRATSARSSGSSSLRTTATSKRLLHRPVLRLRRAYVEPPATPAPIAAAPLKPSPKRITSSSSPHSSAGCWSFMSQSGFHSARDASQRSHRFVQGGLQRSLDHAAPPSSGASPSPGREARHLRLVRRADQLHQRPGLA